MTSTRSLRFARLDNECIVCVSHARRSDGYFRKEWRVDGLKVVEYFHVFIWKAHNGDIPDGHEIDHICHNRACCNPNHLQSLPVIVNRAKKNVSHNILNHDEAREYWIQSKPSIKELSEKFTVSRMTSTRWINRWTLETSLH